MRFLNPQALLFLIGWVGLIPLWFLLERFSAQRLSRFASLEILSRLTRGLSLSRKRSRFFILLLVLLFSIFALTRPQIGSHEETLKSEGLDIVILLDVSNSMLAEDEVPSRLKKAKHWIRNFVDRLSGDRVGVVAFAGSSYPAVPLTTDYDFLKQTLEILDEKSISNQGTDIEAALAVGINLILRGGLNENEGSLPPEAIQSGRVILVLSDGESHDAVKETRIRDLLKQNGIRLFGIGVGSLKGGPIPLRDEHGTLRGYKRDNNGNMVLTRVEPELLEGLANQSQGKYFSASANEGEIEEIFGELRSLDRREGAARTVIVYEELYQIPLAMAVLLLLILLFGKEASAVTAAFLLVLLPWNAFCATSLDEYQNSKEGIKAYNEKDFASAVESFGKAQAASPESFKNNFNLGDALLKAKDAESAAREFEQVLKSKDAIEAGRAAYNLGKAFEVQKKHEEALQVYQEGLNRLSESKKMDPELRDRIKRALQETEEKKQQGDQGEKQDQKDQDKKENQDQKNKKYNISRQKQQFKAERMNENDAKKIFKQLQEQEKKAQKHLMMQKTSKPRDSKNEKDW